MMARRGRRWLAVRLAILSASVATAGLASYGDLFELTRSGEASDDNYGAALAGGGDVNGDGLADHIATAIFNDEVASAAGKAYLYLGRPLAAPVADLTLLGEAADDQFGVSVAIGGDINGDGFGDIAVGARFSDRAGKDTGSVFVYFGGPPPGSPGAMDAQPDLVLMGEAQDDWFGMSVDFAGDVNGDGFDDLVVGAPYNDQTGSASGKGYVFLGGAAPDAGADVALFGDAQDDGHFGWSVSRAGDFNGDGFGDIVVGARLYGSGPSRAVGRAYLFLGGTVPDGVPDIVMTGERRDDWFGHEVSAAGDFNGDGFDDLAVGAPFWDDFTDPLLPKSAVGKAYVFYGGPTGVGDGTADWAVWGEMVDDQFADALSDAGDVDGNGASDLIVGAWLHAALGRRAAGKIYLFAGRADGSSPATSPAFTRDGLAADDQFGDAVATAGDGNGDGLSSFVAGAHFADPSGPGSGSATLHFLDCLDLELIGSSLVWGGCGAHASVDLRRGSPAGFPAGDFGSCLAGGLVGPPATDDAIPAPGSVFTYLVAGRNQATQSSTVGFGSSARPRPPLPLCP